MALYRLANGSVVDLVGDGEGGLVSRQGGTSDMNDYSAMMRMPGQLTPLSDQETTQYLGYTPGQTRAGANGSMESLNARTGQWEPSAGGSMQTPYSIAQQLGYNLDPISAAPDANESLISSFFKEGALPYVLAAPFAAAAAAGSLGNTAGLLNQGGAAVGGGAAGVGDAGALVGGGSSQAVPTGIGADGLVGGGEGGAGAVGSGFAGPGSAEANLALGLGGGGAASMDPSILNALGQSLGIPNLAQWLPLLKSGVGIAGGLNTLFGKGANAGDPSTLFGAGNQVWQTAQDPQQALYDRTLQQTQDQSRAATSARGIGMGPVAAGIENDATRNFNIDWQNQQLNRQTAGANTLANTYRAGTGQQQAKNANSAAGTNALLTGLGGLSGTGGTGGMDLSWLTNMFSGGANAAPSGSTPAGGGYDPTAYLTSLQTQASGAGAY